MRRIEVVERYELYCPETGATASAHGAVPPGYELRKRGWTWKVTHRTGAVTFGLCRPPAATREEALRVARNVALRHRLPVEVA